MGRSRGAFMGRRTMAAGFVAAMLLIALLPAGVAATTTGGASAQAALNAGAKPTKVIVLFKERPGAAAKAVVQKAGGKIRRTFHLIKGISATVPANAIAGLRRNPLVAAVNTDLTLKAFDFEYDNAWGVSRIGAEATYNAGITGAGVKVAIIDTGIDYIHDQPPSAEPPVVDPELLHNYKGGYDFFNNDADPMDDNGHGTHVSGILAAENNEYLVVGVAPEASVYGLKILGADGSGDESDLIAALQWSVDNGIQVVNMSLGTHDQNLALQQAVQNAYGAGLLMVAASGNVSTIAELFNGCPVAYPAAYPEVLATSYTDADDKLTGLSCTGPQIDFGAPGDNIPSTVPVGSCANCDPNGYKFLSGTSMASPHLAGAVALMLDYGMTDANANGTVFDEVRSHLCATAATASYPAKTDSRYPNWYGCGIVNVQNALVTNPPGPVNQVPVAGADNANVAEDGSVDVDVLANDTDADGDALSLTAVGAAGHGATSIVAGKARYQPAANYNGSDVFTYTVSDGRGGSAQGNVSVTVTPVQDPPVAAADSATVTEDGSVDIDVLANDSDVDGDALTLTAVGAASHGTTSIVAGKARYVAAANYNGADSFGYTISDGTATASGTVSISVTSMNDEPTAAAKSASTTSGTPVTITLDGTDVETCELTFSIVSGPLNGALGSITGAGCTTGSPNADQATVTYTSNPGFVGNEQFTYRVADGSGGSATAIVSITVSSGPASSTVHVGDLDGSSASSSKAWTATITIVVRNGANAAVSGATVGGTWSAGATGTSSCTTNASGVCSVQKTAIAKKTASVTFTVTSLAAAGYTYQPSANTDPDGSSNGTTITVRRV